MSNFIILSGILLIIFGIIVRFIETDKTFLLPGDILIKKENFIFYFPITTLIILSILLSIFFYLFFK